jgi:hypothetical protein
MIETSSENAERGRIIIDAGRASIEHRDAAERRRIQVSAMRAATIKMLGNFT